MNKEKVIFDFASAHKKIYIDRESGLETHLFVFPKQEIELEIIHQPEKKYWRKNSYGSPSEPIYASFDIRGQIRCIDKQLAFQIFIKATAWLLDKVLPESKRKHWTQRLNLDALMSSAPLNVFTRKLDYQLHIAYYTKNHAQLLLDKEIESEVKSNREARRYRGVTFF